MNAKQVIFAVCRGVLWWVILMVVILCSAQEQLSFIYEGF